MSRVEAELSSQQLTFQEINAALQECQSSNNALTFQLNKTRVESQIKDREIHRLRSAAPCASTSGSPPKPPKSSAPPVGSVPGSSEASWVHLESSDPPPERNFFLVPSCLLLCLRVKFLPSQLHQYQTLAWTN